MRVRCGGVGTRQKRRPRFLSPPKTPIPRRRRLSPSTVIGRLSRSHPRAHHLRHTRIVVGRGSTRHSHARASLPRPSEPPTTAHNRRRSSSERIVAGRIVRTLLPLSPRIDHDNTRNFLVCNRSLRVEKRKGVIKEILNRLLRSGDAPTPPSSTGIIVIVIIIMTAKSKRNATEPRRANKPLMEKRRRARINQSLAALKALILDSAKQDNTKHSKLEKADILELTVRHFQRHRSLETPGIHQYRAGYSDCVKEVQRYLDTPDAHTMTVIDTGVKQRLLRHLDNCVAEVDTDIRPQIPIQPQVPAASSLEDRLQPPPDSSTIEEVNNNAAKNDLIVQQELKQPLLPTKMVKTYDGSFVFVLPSHYLQLATALGINLRPQVEPQPPPQPPPSSSSGEPSSPLSSVKEENIDEPTASNHLQQPKCDNRPLDYSKNNDACDMWRPW
ncbi:hypothetical protein Trydic_g12105 [Trypoxylus dichotomus]